MASRYLVILFYFQLEFNKLFDARFIYKQRFFAISVSVLPKFFMNWPLNVAEVLLKDTHREKAP